MLITSVFRDYLFWHYSAAYADIFGIIRNYLWVVNRKFSVLDVLKNLFAPFKRLKEEKVNIIHSPSDFFAGLVVNIIMRIVGCIVRIALIAAAFAAFLVVIMLGILGALLWTALPVLVVYFFISGLDYFF